MSLAGSSSDRETRPIEGPVLEAFARALSRETANLARWPDLLWQQLSNRLQWAAGPARSLVATEFELRRTASRTWLHVKNPVGESPALEMTFAGHEGHVLTCAAAADGSFVLSGGEDSTVRVWDAVSGACRGVLREEGRHVACAISPDSTLVASLTSAGVVTVWDVRAERVLSTATAGMCGRRPRLTFTADGAYIVTLADEALGIWETHSGRSAATLPECTDFALAQNDAFVAAVDAQGGVFFWDEKRGLDPADGRHDDKAAACALSDDGLRLVTVGGYDVRAWECETGRQTMAAGGRDGFRATCAISPDCALAFAGGQNAIAELWDLDTGELREDLRPKTRDSIRALAISPDGETLAWGAEDGVLGVIDTITAAEKFAFAAHEMAVLACGVSPDGTWVVSAGDDATLKIWDARDGALLRVLEGHTSPVNDCAVAPDGTFVVSASDDMTLIVWDWPTGTIRHTLTGHDDGVTRCAIAPDGSWVVSGSRDGTLRIWETDSGLVRCVFENHKAEVTDCAVDDAGSHVVSADGDGVVIIWGAADGEVVHSLYEHTAAATTCSFSPRGGFVVSGGKDGHVRVWDVDSGEERFGELEDDDEDSDPWYDEEKRRFPKPLHEGGVLACEISPDGATIVSTGSQGEVCAWDAQTGRRRLFFGDPEEYQEVAGSCVIDPHGGWLATGHEDGSLRIWDLDTGVERPVARGHTGYVVAAAFTPDGRWLITGQHEYLIVWEMPACRPRSAIPVNGVPRFALGDGDCIVTELRDAVLAVWDMATGARLATLDGHGGSIRDFTLAADGGHVVSASDDGTLIHWRIEQTPESETFSRHHGAVTACRLAGLNDEYVVSCGEDGVVLVWSIAEGAVSSAFRGHATGITACAALGMRVLTGGSDGSLKVWEPVSGQVAELEGHSGEVTACDIGGFDGWLAVTASHDETAAVWSLDDFLLLNRFTDHGDFVYDCAIDPGGERAVTRASSENAEPFKIWEPQEGTEFLNLTSYDYGVTNMAMSPDGSFVACVVSIDRSSRVMVLDLESPDEDEAVTWETDKVSACAVGSDSASLLTGHESGDVGVWDPRTGESLVSFRAHEGEVVDCALAPGNELVVSTAQRCLLVSRIRDGGVVARLPVHEPTEGVAIHPEAPFMAIGDRRGCVRLVTVEGLGPKWPGFDSERASDDDR